MITRLKIDGFKNLVNVDVYLDTFICIAGANAVGKSNLFDAIFFLSKLADYKVIDAAKLVRSESQKASDIRDIFLKIKDQHSEVMSFEVEMIIPNSATDESEEKAEASITTIKYDLTLRYVEEDGDGRIIIEKESLNPITQGGAKENIYFSNTPKWRKTVIKGRRTSEFISTYQKDGKKMIRLHQDQTKGKPYDRIAAQLPRTVLSTATAEYPTACVVRQEMKSWMLLQMEPSALRESDDFEKRRSATVGANGANIPATIFRLQTAFPDRDIYQRLANRLSELVDNVESIEIDKDEKRALLTLLLKFKGQSALPARSLSDGTLRFLALAILELDNRSGSVICLEEPENGIHPSKIEAILRLLQDIACDTDKEANEDNPFRQVIINTHSPLVVQQVPEGSLLVLTNKQYFDEGRNQKIKVATFAPLSDTWRMKIPNTFAHPIIMGQLLDYLSGKNNTYVIESQSGKPLRKKRVFEREDVSQLSLF